MRAIGCKWLIVRFLVLFWVVFLVIWSEGLCVGVACNIVFMVLNHEDDTGAGTPRLYIWGGDFWVGVDVTV